MKRAFSILLAIAMMMVCMTSAYAATTPEDPINAPQEMTAVVGEPIGTLADDEGEVLFDIQTTSSSGLPFTMYANKAVGLLTTYHSGKSFTGGSFDALRGQGLKIEGTLTHSLGYNVKVGACYYQPDNDTFYSVYPDYFNSGDKGTHWIPKVLGDIMGGTQLFFNQMTYYGHITNHNGMGNITGSLTFTVSTRPW